jgi:hypothetical protein
MRGTHQDMGLMYVGDTKRALRRRNRRSYRSAILDPGRHGLNSQSSISPLCRVSGPRHNKYNHPKSGCSRA